MELGLELECSSQGSYENVGIAIVMTGIGDQVSSGSNGNILAEGEVIEGFNVQ